MLVSKTFLETANDCSMFLVKHTILHNDFSVGQFLLELSKSLTLPPSVFEVDVGSETISHLLLLPLSSILQPQTPPV